MLILDKKITEFQDGKQKVQFQELIGVKHTPWSLQVVKRSLNVFCMKNVESIHVISSEINNFLQIMFTLLVISHTIFNFSELTVMFRGFSAIFVIRLWRIFPPRLKFFLILFVYKGYRWSELVTRSIFGPKDSSGLAENCGNNEG